MASSSAATSPLLSQFATSAPALRCRQAEGGRGKCVGAASMPLRACVGGRGGKECLKLALQGCQSVAGSVSRQPARAMMRWTLQPTVLLGVRGVELRAVAGGTVRGRRVAEVRAAVNSTDIPTVTDTKRSFLQAYPRPIPSLYNNVIQELIVQHHLLRYNSTYKYNAVFALGFVTVYDQLMDGYRVEADKEAIFKAYVEALKESPEQYRKDSVALEAWAANQTVDSITDFTSSSGDVVTWLQEVAERAKEGKFHYSRFFAIGLFRILTLAKLSDPAALEKLCQALNISKASVDRDLDVYRGLLSKLTQAKDLMKEFLDREKKKKAEREAEKVAKAAPPATA